MIAFCTTCKGRVQHLEKTLPANLANNPTGKFIVLDYNSQDHLIEYLKSNHADAIESGRLVVYSYREPVKFRMGHAKNMAHRCAMLEGATVLVNLDADNLTGPSFAEYILDQFTREPGIFMWGRMVQGVMPRGISGRIAITVEQFLKSGGYDEKFVEWGRDDKDLNERLLRMGCPAREFDSKYLDGVRHNDKIRFKEYPHVRCSEESGLVGGDMYEPLTNTIVNFGNIGVGTVYRNFGDTPIELKPVPTRIFGIGMHKTGTTSLHTALGILGIESAHWKNAHWAKAIWREMNAEGKSATLEKSYALSDLPIPLLFKQLDKAYPGSKFILTVRNERRWLRSVKNHWDAKRNKYRSSWDKDPFTHIIHRALYGQTNFDPDVFLARYRRHNAEVKEYFKKRSGDLLIMNLDRSAGWKELCGFLGRPVPTVAYPKAFMTKRWWRSCKTQA